MKKISILLVMLFVCLTGCVYAGNLVKKVYFSPYPILIDDEEYSSEMPILSYQDRTYVALREFSEMVGVEIDFEKETIIINTKKTNHNEKNNSSNAKEDLISKEVTTETKQEESEVKVSTKSEIVYITQSGSKYHLISNCGKGNYYTTTLQDALNDGYTLCKKCGN